MRGHPIRFVAVIVAVVVCAFSVLAATRPNFEASAELSPLLGKPAPEFATTSLTGAPFHLASHRGHYVVVNFFASWCVPCRTEAPDLVEFAYTAKRDGVPVDLVSVVFNDADVEALAFVRTIGMQWPALRDRNGAIAASYGVTSPPTSVIMSPSGKVVAVLIGPTNNQQLRDLIARDQRGTS